MSATNSTPPPAGIYVPAVVFFNENDELDTSSIKAHVLRLAQVEFFLALTNLPS